MDAWRQRGVGRLMRNVWVVGALFLLVSCASIQFEAGRRVDPAALEQSLRIGASTASDVEAALGQPYGKGRAMMQFHDTPRTVWSYYHERGSIDAGSGENQTNQLFLFVFLLNDRYDGYIWFKSDLR